MIYAITVYLLLALVGWAALDHLDGTQRIGLALVLPVVCLAICVALAVGWFLSLPERCA